MMFQILGYILIPVHTVTLLVFAKALHGLTVQLNEKMTNSTIRNRRRSTKESIKTKKLACTLGIISNVCLLTFWSSVIAIGISTVDHAERNNNKVPHGQQIAASVQSVAYALSAACVFHMCGYWLLLVADLISSTFSFGNENSSQDSVSSTLSNCSSSQRWPFTVFSPIRRRSSSSYSRPQVTITMKNMTTFSPTKKEWLLFVVPAYIGLVAAIGMVVARGCSQSDWLSIGLTHRVLFTLYMIPLVSVIVINYRVVSGASKLINELATAYPVEGAVFDHTDTRREGLLLSLSKRVRKLSLFTTFAAVMSVIIGLIVVISDWFTSDIFVFIELVIIIVLVVLFWILTFKGLICEHNTKSVSRHSSRNRLPPVIGSEFDQGSDHHGEDESVLISIEKKAIQSPSNPAQLDIPSPIPSENHEPFSDVDIDDPRCMNESAKLGESDSVITSETVLVVTDHPPQNGHVTKRDSVANGTSVIIDTDTLQRANSEENYVTDGIEKNLMQTTSTKASVLADVSRATNPEDVAELNATTIKVTGDPNETILKSEVKKNTTQLEDGHATVNDTNATENIVIAENSNQGTTNQEEYILAVS